MDVWIIDMDGTLCDVRGIRHYINENRNFAKFHRASLWCPPNQFVVELAQTETPNIIVTARSTEFEWETRSWLAKYDIPYVHMYMRQWGDVRPDYVVKGEILQQIRADGFVPQLAIDDNPAVVQLWRENNIPTLVVPGWSDSDGKVSYKEREQ